MAKSCPVNVFISKDNITDKALAEALQEIHIEALKEILENLDLTDSQMHRLLMVLERRVENGE
ncbi:MAG: hypothetical protein OSJ45_08375 [Lachnospiraceae bacterium]|nr:hypothetical protein [Lachnospiraceae bacterium]